MQEGQGEDAGTLPRIAAATIAGYASANVPHSPGSTVPQVPKSITWLYGAGVRDASRVHDGGRRRGCNAYGAMERSRT